MTRRARGAEVAPCRSASTFLARLDDDDARGAARIARTRERRAEGDALRQPSSSPGADVFVVLARRGRGFGRTRARGERRGARHARPGQRVRRDVVAHRRAALGDGHRARRRRGARHRRRRVRSAARAPARVAVALWLARRAPRRSREQIDALLAPSSDEPGTSPRASPSAPRLGRAASGASSSSSRGAISRSSRSRRSCSRCSRSASRLRLVPLRLRAARRPARRVHDGLRAARRLACASLLTFRPALRRAIAIATASASRSSSTSSGSRSRSTSSSRTSTRRIPTCRSTSSGCIAAPSRCGRSRMGLVVLCRPCICGILPARVVHRAHAPTPSSAVGQGLPRTRDFATDC